MATEIVIPVKIENATSVRDLRTNINTLRDSLVGVDSSSEQYRKTLVKLGEQQNKLNNINRDARNSALNLEQQLNNIVRISGSVAAGFSTVTAIGGLLGSENEALAETFVRVQSAMALVQGIKGLAGLQNTIPAVVTGFRNLTIGVNLSRTAIIALTGVFGLLTAAVVLIVSNFDKIKDIVDRLIPSLNNLRKSSEEYKTSVQSINTVLERNIELLRASGGTENEILSLRTRATKQIIQQSEDRIKALEDELNDTGNILLRFSSIYRVYYAKIQTDLRKQIEETKEILNNASGDLLDIQDAYALAAIERGRILRENAAKEEEQRTKDAKKAADERLKIKEKELLEIGEINDRLLNEDLTSYEIRLNELQKTFLKERSLYQKNGQDISALTESYYNALNELISEEEERLNEVRYNENRKRLNDLEEVNNEALEQQRIYIQELETLRLEAIARGEENGTIEEIEQRISEQQSLFTENQILFQEQYRLGLEELLNDVTLNAEQRIIIHTELQDKLNEIELLGLEERKRIAGEEIKAQQQQAKTEAAIDEERRRGKLALLSALSKISSAAVDIIGQETVVGKSIAVAGATIDTFRAGVSAFAATPGGPIIKGAALAATIATGLATVAKIISTKVPGQSDSESLPDPNVNIEDVTDEPIERVTNTLTSTEEQDLNEYRNRQMTVAVTEINEVQSRVRVVESESTFS